ncbi:MAG: hypothetical protein RR047_01645 [Bacilli bacterium]
MEKAEIIIKNNYNQVKMFVRDLFLKEDTLKMYTKGLIIVEPSFTEMTYKIGGLNKKHNTRFIILSNHATDMQELEEDTSWGLYVIHPNAYFKVLDILTINSKFIIILLHIQAEDKLFFMNNDVSYDQQFINNSQLLMTSVINTKPIPNIDNDLWARHVNFPIGINDDNSFFK